VEFVIFFSEIMAGSCERPCRDTKNPNICSLDSFLSPVRTANPHQLALTLALFGSAEQSIRNSSGYPAPHSGLPTLQRRRAYPFFADAKRRLTMKQLSKIAIIGALLAATVSAASAQGYDRAHDQQAPAYSQQNQNAPQNEPNKSDVGEDGGA
jgi:hypothetical protein